MKKNRNLFFSSHVTTPPKPMTWIYFFSFSILFMANITFETMMKALETAECTECREELLCVGMFAGVYLCEKCFKAWVDDIRQKKQKQWEDKMKKLKSELKVNAMIMDIKKPIIDEDKDMLIKK